MNTGASPLQMIRTRHSSRTGSRWCLRRSLYGRLTASSHASFASTSGSMFRITPRSVAVNGT